MWTEIIIPLEDLGRLVAQAFPLSIHLGDAESDNSLELSDLGEVRLVPDEGLRVQCKARVRWPVLGIELPVALNALTLMLVPSIGKGPHGDTLVFRISIEHADFTAVPEMIDKRITATINSKLAANDAELSWDLSRALTLSARLPALLEDLEAFALRPHWAKVRVTDQAVVYAVSFNTALVRRGGQLPAEVTLATGRAALSAEAPSEPPAGAHLTQRPRRANGLASAGMFGIGAGAAYFALRLVARAFR
jgi:hypothetical protein